MATFNSANGSFVAGDRTVNRFIIISHANGMIADTHGDNQESANGANLPAIKEVVLIAASNGSIIDTFR